MLVNDVQMYIYNTKNLDKSQQKLTMYIITKYHRSKNKLLKTDKQNLKKQSKK